MWLHRVPESTWSDLEMGVVSCSLEQLIEEEIAIHDSPWTAGCTDSNRMLCHIGSMLAEAECQVVPWGQSHVVMLKSEGVKSVLT